MEGAGVSECVFHGCRNYVEGSTEEELKRTEVRLRHL